MIQVTIAGRVGRSELKEVNGSPLLAFSVAADIREGRDKSTQWASCAIWGKRAEALAQYVTKGSHVTVTGSAKVRTYQASSETKAELDIRVDNIALQGGGTAGDKDEIPF